jgi:hypothetical protein
MRAVVLLFCAVSCGTAPPRGAPVTRLAEGGWSVTNACSALMDGEGRAIAHPNARVWWHLDDGYVQREIFLEIQPLGAATYFDNQRQGANAADPPYCGRKRFDLVTLDRLDETLLAHHVCDLHGPKELFEPDIAPDHLIFHTGRVDCDVYIPRKLREKNADAAAVMAAIEQLGPRCPSNVFPCYVAAERR